MQSPGKVDIFSSSEQSLSWFKLIAVTQHPYSVNGVSLVTVAVVLDVVTVSTAGR